MTRIRLGIIGAGMAFEPHALALQDLSGRAEAVAVAARSQAQRDAVGSRFGFPTVALVEELLARPGIDAVLVLTPPATHPDLVAMLAAAGKHVLLEKPLAISSRDAVTVVKHCQDKGVLLGSVFQHRFREAAMALQALVAQGRLGRLSSVLISIPWWRPQGYYDQPGRGTLARDGGGVLLTQAIHTLDLALALAGPVDEVFAYAATTPLHRMETEDLVTGVLKFASGAIGTLSATTACYPGGTEQIRLIGEKGSACLEGEALQVDFLDGSSRRLGSAGMQGGGADPMAFSHASHRGLLAAFFDAVEAGRTPTPGGREALEVQLLIDALLRSAQTGRPLRPDRAD